MDRTDAPSSGLLAAGRPLLALASVWLTTAGHTMAFREMNNAHGWITTVGYSLHTAYLFAVFLSLPLGPALARRFGDYAVALAGLALLAGGAFTNGLWWYAPWGVVIGGRVAAGAGAGLVLSCVPRLIAPRWERPAVWAGIVLPAVGPPAVSAVDLFYGQARWEGGFLFEGLLALGALGLLLSMTPPPQRELPAPRRLAYLPALAAAVAGIWYVLHWGQLGGWWEGKDVFAALALVILAGSVAFCMALPGWDGSLVWAALPRVVLVGFAGFTQFFNAADMGVYGGLLLNYDVLQRSFLIWSLSVGAGCALAVGELLPHSWVPRGRGVLAGLLLVAAGMTLAHNATLGWPFWLELNVVDLNWFAAPQAWELAPARFLMGFGSATILLAESRAGTNPAVEARLKAWLPEAQIAGGALGVGVLATALLTVHQLEYAYAADRGTIQATEAEARRERLTEVLRAAGSAEPARQAEVLTYRSVNYQADNLIFADIYGAFTTAALGLAAAVAVGLVVARLRDRLGKAQSSSPGAAR